MKRPVLWDSKDEVWFYGGIRSVGKFVVVLDHEKQPKEVYDAGASRRKTREWLKQEFSDSLAMVPLDI